VFFVDIGMCCIVRGCRYVLCFRECRYVLCCSWMSVCAVLFVDIGMCCVVRGCRYVLCCAYVLPASKLRRRR